MTKLISKKAYTDLNMRCMELLKEGGFDDQLMFRRITRRFQGYFKISAGRSLRISSSCDFNPAFDHTERVCFGRQIFEDFVLNVLYKMFKPNRLIFENLRGRKMFDQEIADAKGSAQKRWEFDERSTTPRF